VLRFIDMFNLEQLERWVTRSNLLQRFVLSKHEQAFRRLLGPRDHAGIRSVAVVGGGLFPRTAMVLRKLLPDSSITIIDENPAHVAAAKRWLDDKVEYVVAHYDAAFHRRFDAIVLPLALRGDPEELFTTAGARTWFVHDWVWRRRQNSRIVSWLFFKHLSRIDA
jgi:hypothetical protein